MKKIWKMRRDSEAVSPVIATILMVAITVVLAAVLYVMVMGFGGPTSNPPVAALQYQKTGTNTYKITVVSIDKETLWSDCKLSVVNNTNSAVSGPLAPGSVTVGTENVDLIDLASDTKIGNGDYFTIVTKSGNTYTISLLWGSKADSIATVTFTAT